MRQDRILRTERQLKTFLESSLFGIFKDGLHPNEIAAQSCDLMMQYAELDERYGRMISPDQFTIHINPREYQDLLTRHPACAQKIRMTILEYAQMSGCYLMNEPRIVFIQDYQTERRSFTITAIHSGNQALSTQSLDADIDENRADSLPISAELVTEKQHFPIEKATIGIGRQKDNDIILEDMIVSRHHAQIRWRREDFILIDLNSHNGTYINGLSTSESILQNGDVLAIGKTKFIFTCAVYQRDFTEETRPISDII